MTLRAIAPKKWADITPNDNVGAEPVFMKIDPTQLLVDDSYQRDLSEPSVRLMRKTLGSWNWAHFKPPVVRKRPDGRFVVIDGQHTAIVAASHPKIGKIPVCVVETGDNAGEALAFVGQNLNRINLTPLVIHHAKLAAGDEDALTIDQVCKKAKVRVLRTSPGAGRFAVGDTMAVNVIGAVIKRRHAMNARKVLDVLVAAERAPLKASEIMAVESLMFGAERDKMTPEQITNALKSDPVLESKGKMMAEETGMRLWQAIAKIILRWR